MFTGIVQGLCPVERAVNQDGLLRLLLALPGDLGEGLVRGASVSVDGVCLTVTGLGAEGVAFDVMAETLALTTLAALREGSLVNIERSARQGAEIGGHLVSGHIDGTAGIIAVERAEGLHRVRYRPPPRLLGYLFHKGFVALNGCSLTIAALDRAAGWFEVSYIPETLQATNHGRLLPGDQVNLEVDRQTQVIVDTVERVLAEHPRTRPGA